MKIFGIELKFNGFDIWHKGNQGSGSGMDADKLDSKEGSYYLDWANMANKPDPTITISGDASGSATLTDLASKTIDLSITKVDPSTIGPGYTPTNRTYINTHPENGGAIIPFINNDLAFLLSRGGSMSSYKTTSTDYTALSLVNSGSVGIDTKPPFDGSASYSAFTVSTINDVVVIDLVCPKTFLWSTNFYIDFGATAWRAKNVFIYAFNSDSDNGQQYYKLMGSISNSALGEFACYASYSYIRKSDGGTSQGFNRLRFVLTNFNGTSPRIACLGVINYNSSGLQETFISRGGSSVYGGLYPHANDAYDLGTIANKWANIYATAFRGNADTAGKLKTARTIKFIGDVTGSGDFDGDANINIAMSSRKVAMVGSDAASSNGWYKVASQTCSGYGNTNITFVVTSTHGNYYSGILELQIRSDNTSISCRTLKWLSRIGFDPSNFVVVISGMTWTLYVNQLWTQYGRICFEIISQSSTGNKDQGWSLTFSDNYIKETVNPTPTVASTDGGIVESANKLNGLAPSSFMRTVNANGYYGMARGSDGDATDWIRTTSNGIIPYASGGASALGTSTWPFNLAYIKTIYENGVALSTKYAPKTHKHVKADITDMPTKLSEFQNDIGAGGGIKITTSPTAPGTTSPGDFWYKEI